MRNSILLKTLALSTMIPFSMWGQNAVFEDFQYEITAENTVTITGYTGANTEVSIPAEIEGLPVRSVGIRAFMGSDLTRIEIPDSVTEISSGAFNGCVSLSEVKIPNSVTTIGGYAFSLCKSLEEVVIPASVTLIDEEAFRGCESLSKVYLRGRELTIKSLAFADCPQLEGVYSYSSVPFEIDLDYRKGTYPYPFDSTVVVYYPAEYEENWTQTVEVVPVPGAPDTDWVIYTHSITNIQPWDPAAVAGVFEGFQYEITAENTVTITGYAGTNTEVSIPSEIEGLPVRSVGIRAFMGSDLTRIEIPDSVTEISSGAFNGCVSLSEVKIPNSVTTIGGYAFSLCKSLEEVVIPASVTLIDEEAFRGCESLSKVYLRGRELTIKSLAFADCPQLEGVYSYSSVPFEIDLDYRKGTYPYPFDSTVVVYYPAEYEENWTQTVEVVPVPGAPDTDWVIYTHSITNIQPWDPAAVAGVFEDFQYEITAENTVTITGYAGTNTEVSIPSEIEGLPVRSVGASAFVESQLLESIVLPEGVLSVGKEAFRYCENLRSVSLPESLQNLGRNAFEYCYALEEISIPANVETVNEGDNSQPFKFCESLVSIEVDPDNRNYKSEEGVLFSKDGKTLIAYPGSRVGESYQIQEGVEKLGDYAFCKAQNLQEVTLGEDVEEIGAFCFAVMPALVNINFNEKVRVLGMGAFRANESLEEITLPDSVEELGIATFTDCGSLSRVTIGKGISKLDYFQFSGSLNLAEVAVSEENPNYSTESGVVYDKEKTTLIYYPPARAGEEFEVPAGIKRVEMEMNSGNLKRLILPATVSSFNVCWKEEEMALEDIYFKGASPDMESTILPASDKVEYHYLEGMGGWKENDSPDNWPKSTFGFEYSPQLNFTIWSLPEDSAELYIGKREQSAEGKNTLNLVFGGMLESSVDQQTWSEVTSVSPYTAEIEPGKKFFYRVRALTAE